MQQTPRTDGKSVQYSGPPFGELGTRCVRIRRGAVEQKGQDKGKTGSFAWEQGARDVEQREATEDDHRGME